MFTTLRATLSTALLPFVHDRQATTAPAGQASIRYLPTDGISVAKRKSSSNEESPKNGNYESTAVPQEEAMKKSLAVMLVFAMSLFSMSAYANPGTRDKTRRGAIIGAVTGAVLGGVIGNNRGSGDQKKGAIVGAVAGTAIGAGIGAYMDKQERELRQIEGVEVTRTADDELNVTVRNEVLFDFNSASLRYASKESLREMARVFNRYGDTSIAVEGHTDSVGSNQYNYRLSQRRASSVANYLEAVGVDGYRLDTEAYGESQPRTSNASASGRQLNRRVELRVKADRG